MILFEAIEIQLEDGWHDMSLFGGEYCCRGICVHIDSRGTVRVEGNKTPVYRLRLTAQNTYFNNALILGDTWERAYGDLAWRKPDYQRFMPWYFIAYENGKTYGFGVKTQPESMCSWQCNSEKITLNIDLRNGSLGLALCGRKINACEIVAAEYEGDLYDAAGSFCASMCENPRRIKKPVYGGNDWYCNYGDNSFEKIARHTQRIAECSAAVNPPYMVVDDGWQICHHYSDDHYKYFNGGPWRYCNNNFSDMGRMAEEIERNGVIPGIWFRPLWTAEKFPADCILKTDGIKITLDPSSAEVLEIVGKDVKILKNWGYKLIKHDFSTFDIFGLWGNFMGGDVCQDELKFSDRTKTTAQIIKNFYKTIRESAGEDVMLMGCNTISHLSAGIFDIQRTGDDTSGKDWERTKKYGINTLAFRMPQHGNFYCADADCVGITGMISWSKNRQWLDVLSKSGTALFVSIAEDAYTNEIRSDITKAFNRAAQNLEPSRPLDWIDSIAPEKWKSIYGVDSYEW